MVFAIISSSIILLLFIRFSSRLYDDYKKTLNDINIINESVDIIKPGILNVRHHDVIDVMKSKVKDANSDLLKYWIEFEESLVISEEIIENTLDAEHFFNERNIGYRLFNNQTYENVSQSLIGLGVLFTFGGLIYGLRGITLDSESIEVLKSGIEQLIIGAQTAFITSFIGILLSLIYNIGYFKFKRDITLNILELQKSINFKYPRTNPEKSLAYIRDSSNETSIAIGSLSEQLGEKLQEVVREMSGEVSKSFQETITPYMEQIANKAMNASESVLGDMMETFIDKIGLAGEKQQELILETNKSIQEAIIDFRSNFTGQVIELKDTIKNLNDSYHFIEEHLISQFDNAITKFSEAIEGYQEEQNEFIAQLNNQKETVQKLDEVSTKLQIIMNRIQEQISQSVSAYRQATDNLSLVYESNNEASNKLIDIASSFEQPLNVLNSQYEQLQETIQSTTQTIQNELEQALKSYFTQVESQTTERLREWNNQTTTFSTAMLNVTTQLNNLVDNISKNVKDSK